MSATESLVHSVIVIVLGLLVLKEFELELDRVVVRLPLARVIRFGASIALLLMLGLLGACGDNDELTATPASLDGAGLGEVVAGDECPPPPADSPRYFGVHLCSLIGCDASILTCPVPDDPTVPCHCAAPSPTGPNEWCLREVQVP
jgi:hypothetical protein